MRKRYTIIATAFDKRGRVISTGRNNYQKSHPLMAHFAKIAQESEEKICLHAEVSALVQAKDRKVHSLLVQRIEGTGFGLAKPCKTCSEAIKAFGVKFVQYTMSDGSVGNYAVE
jgi:deoxycytidylate deaminase